MIKKRIVREGDKIIVKEYILGIEINQHVVAYTREEEEA